MIEKDSKKRILIVNGYSMNTKNATGITLKSIFSQWDKSNLLEIVSSEVEVTGKEEVRTLKLPDSSYPVNYLLRFKKVKQINKNSKDKVVSNSINNGNSMSNRFRKTIISIVDALPFFPPKKALKEVIDFQPDYIYTLGGGILPMRMVLYFSKKTNAKIVIHFMDNWQDTLYTDSVFQKPSRLILLSMLKKVYSKTDKALTISEKMAEQYEKKWAIPHFTLMNSINLREQENTSKRNDNRISIVYAGGLHLERWKSIKVVSDTIDKVNEKNNLEISLTIYTNSEAISNYQQIFTGESTELKESVPHDQVNSIYDKADILLHIESFNEKIIPFTKFSISTKIPEYMNSSKPILLFAPNSLALSDYIKDKKSGFSCSNIEELSEALIKLSQSADLRVSLGSNGYKCAVDNHSLERTKELLDRVFE